MKILAINGSHRGRKGCTQFLLERIVEGALSVGAEFEAVALAELKINACLACDVCCKPATLGHCVFEEKDDVKSVFDRMKAADVVIYATPAYVFNMTGLMKTFLDRLNSTGTGTGLCLSDSGLIFHPIDRQVTGKPMVILTLCANIEPDTLKNIVSYFQTYAKFVDAPVAGTLARTMAPQLMEDHSAKAAQEVLAAFVQAGRELAMNKKIDRSTEKTASRSTLGIPFLNLLLQLKGFKKKMIEQVNREKSGQTR